MIFAVGLLFLKLFSDPIQDTVQGDSLPTTCKEIVYTSENSSECLILYLLGKCDTVLPRGFAIARYESDTVWEIVWSKLSVDQNLVESYSMDFDCDGINEFITLFTDEFFVWGFAHRYSARQGKLFSMQSLELPLVGKATNVNDFKYSRINPNNTFTLPGMSDLGFKGLTVVYDEAGDSLSIEYGEYMGCRH